MSIKLMSAAWDLDLPQTEKMVLLALCDHANDDGFCWPSMGRLARRCGVSDRTVRNAMNRLEEQEIVKRHGMAGRANHFQIDPGKICTPETDSAPPRKEFPDTPETGSPKPSVNHQSKKQHARELPANWEPAEFGIGTKCRGIVDGWPPGELEVNLEHFAAHHRARGNKFKEWQDAWKTWVLGSRKFNNGNKFQGRSGNGPDKRSGLARAIDAELGSIRPLP